MKRELLAMAIAGTLVFVASDHLAARGPGGGGGGGGRGGGGGGGGARPAPSAGRSPSMSAGARPAQPASRPSAQARPSTGTATARPAGAGTTKAATGGAAKKASPAGAGTAKAATGAAGAARPGAAAGSRPSSSQVNNFLDVPKASKGGAAVAGGARASGGAAGDFLQQGGARPGQLPAGGAAAARTAASGRVASQAGVGRQGAAAAVGVAGAAGAAGARRQNLAESGAGRIENRQELQQNRSDRVNELHDQCNDTPVRDFWSDNPVWGAFAVTRPFRAANWGAVGGWMGYGTTEPGYYNYGENMYYQDGAVYSGDQQVATAEEYAQQAEDLVASAPEAPAKDMQWMPLGVFALTQDGEASGAPPSLFMQLVLSKQGVISGTFSNKTTGETQTLEGMIDKESQRAAWGIEGQQRPIAETGLANLTKDSSPALIHFADGSTQQWLLVRLEDPSEKK